MSPTHGTLIITGASSGLGLACVQHFSQLGYQIACCDIQQSFQSYPDACQAFQVDVTQSTTIENMLLGITDWAPIKGLINCAGIARGERVVGRDAAMPLANFKQVVDVNLIGTFDMIRLVANVMAVQGQGDRVMVNTASIAAFEGQVGQAAYSASKGGIVSMTLPLARELKQFGIRVVTIAPGLMETPMTSGMSEKVQNDLQSHCQYPPRFGQPEEFAQLVGQVVENQYLNGCVLRLDGAVRLR